MKKLRKGLSKHHLTPRSRRGDSQQSNLLVLKNTRHVLWHKTFGNRTLDECIGLMSYRTQRVGWIACNKHREIGDDVWQEMWGNKDFYEVLRILGRVKRLKDRLR